MKRRYLTPLFLGVLTFVWALPIQAEQTSVQQKIRQQQNKIDEQKRKRENLQSTLRNQELEMGKVLDSLKKTEMTLAETREAIKRAEQEIKRLEKQEKLQKEKLKEQLDSAYRAGIHPSVLERLLSENAKQADRIGAYYEHINQVRIDAIHELRQTQAELTKRRDELRGQQKGVQTQLSEQKKQENELKKVQTERASTIRSIDKTLDQEKSRLNELQQNNQRLQNQVQQASDEASKREAQELELLEQQKKREEKRQATEQEKQQVRAGKGLGNSKYPMPVAGKIVNRFGSVQMGELRASGIIIEAKAGTPVRAITGGIVVLADWLQGYGQVVVIDHGNYDMSIYGFNQSISVKKGSRVQAGQIISAVGNSGGQRRAALYFEIRRKAKAVNPLKWVK